MACTRSAFKLHKLLVSQMAGAGEGEVRDESLCRRAQRRSSSGSKKPTAALLEGGAGGHLRQ